VGGLQIEVEQGAECLLSEVTLCPQLPQEAADLLIEVTPSPPFLRKLIALSLDGCGVRVGLLQRTEQQRAKF
jgi:hypothetical protein